jgi:hypothetical protein
MLGHRQLVTSPGQADRLGSLASRAVSGSRMRPVRIITAVVFAAIAITGCTAHATADDPSPTPPTSHPTHRSQPRPDRFDQAQPDRQAQIYTAVLRQYLTSGDASVGAGYRFPQVFVLDHRVADAGAPGHGAPEPG